MGVAARRTEKVSSGRDVLVEKRFAPLRGLALGLICHPTAVGRRLRLAADLFHEARHLRLAALFGPAHPPGFESFCGVHDVAVRHGLTIGELAGLYREERGLDLALTVIPCRSWRRGMVQRDTGLPWVFPSPNMPTPETALVYPGMCLLEGANVSEGRG